jgi:hypothetical protein
MTPRMLLLPAILLQTVTASAQLSPVTFGGISYSPPN